MNQIISRQKNPDYNYFLKVYDLSLDQKRKVARAKNIIRKSFISIKSLEKYRSSPIFSYICYKRQRFINWSIFILKKFNIKNYTFGLKGTISPSKFFLKLERFVKKTNTNYKKNLSSLRINFRSSLLYSVKLKRATRILNQSANFIRLQRRLKSNYFFKHSLHLGTTNFNKKSLNEAQLQRKLANNKAVFNSLIKKDPKLQLNYVYSRFCGILTKRGNQRFAENVFSRIRYIVGISTVLSKRRLTKKLKLNLLKTFKKGTIYLSRNKAVFDILNEIRPALALKRQGKGNSFFNVPSRVSIQRSVSLAQRSVINSSIKRSSNIVSQKITAELVDLYKKKPTQTKNSLINLVQEIYESRTFL